MSQLQKYTFIQLQLYKHPELQTAERFQIFAAVKLWEEIYKLQITNYKSETVPNYKLQIRGTKLQIKNVCSGKARRGDGNDLTANPKKLAAIGETIRFLKTLIIVISFHCRKRAWKVEQRYKLIDSSERGAFPHQVRETEYRRHFSFSRDKKLEIFCQVFRKSGLFRFPLSMQWMTGKINLLWRPRLVYPKPFLNPNYSKITTSCNSGQSHEKRRTSWPAELAGKKVSLNMLIVAWRASSSCIAFKAPPCTILLLLALFAVCPFWTLHLWTYSNF